MPGLFLRKLYWRLASSPQATQYFQSRQRIILPLNGTTHRSFPTVLVQKVLLSRRKAFFIAADVLKRKLPIILDAERLFSTVKMYFYTSNGGKRLNKKAPCFHKVPWFVFCTKISENARVDRFEYRKRISNMKMYFYTSNIGKAFSKRKGTQLSLDAFVKFTFGAKCGNSTYLP